MTPPETGPSRLRSNVLATYASQAYVAVVGIAFVPLYLRLLGTEAYGLIGFFTVLQATFAVLDLGLTRTISRETARFHAHPEDDPLPYRRLFRVLQALFAAIAGLGGVALVVLADPVAAHWLQDHSLPPADVRLALQLMGVTVAFRWMGGLYRGVILGAERIVWSAGFNAAMATLRYGGVLAALLWLGASIAVFFTYQVLLALVELGGLAWIAHRHVPRLPGGTRLGLPIRALRPVLGFSASIAVTSMIWVLVTQADKLLLSRLLDLADYGSFTIGVVVAGTVLLVTRPLSVPLLPRMANLEAGGRLAELDRLYHGATQVTCILAFALSFTLAAFAHEILWAWTGDAAVTAAADSTVALYAVGNAFLAVGAFPFFLQYAKGDLRLHVTGNVVFIGVLVPALVAATLAYGTRGAGWVWLASNLGYVVLWVPVVHRKMAHGLHRRWVLQDVAPILLASGAVALLAHLAAPDSASRVGSVAMAGAAGLAVLAAAVAASSTARERLGTALRRRGPPEATA